MNYRKLFPVIALMVILLAALVAVGLAFGQEGNPGEAPNQEEGGSSAQVPDAISAVPNGGISYQGRLLQGGNPVNATLNITFRLYTVSSGGAAIWTETQSVVVKDGLFSVYLGTVTPLNQKVTSFHDQLWLGVQPAGAASELTPRQPLGAAAYAYGVMPGATMDDTNPVGIYGYSFYVQASSHPAIYGASGSSEGISGYSTAQNHSGLFGQNTAGGANSHGVEGVGAGTGPCPTTSNDCLSGIYASGSGESYGTFSNSGRTAILGRTTTNFYTGWFYSTLAPNGSGIWTNGESVFNDFVTFGGGKSGYVVDIAFNDGSEALEKGDVVAISGFDEPVVGNIPVIKVQKASGSASTGVVGVVDVRYTPCNEAEPLPAGQACGGFDSEVTTIQPGEYLAVVTLGAYSGVKVSAVNGPIEPGDLLAVDGTQNGFAAKAQTATVESVEFVLPGTSFGKALGGLDSGTGLIPVFVTIR